MAGHGQMATQDPHEGLGCVAEPPAGPPYYITAISFSAHPLSFCQTQVSCREKTESWAKWWYWVVLPSLSKDSKRTAFIYLTIRFYPQSP